MSRRHPHPWQDCPERAGACHDQRECQCDYARWIRDPQPSRTVRRRKKKPSNEPSLFGGSDER